MNTKQCSSLAAGQTAKLLLDNTEQRFEAFVHGVPNGLVEYQLIIVAVDVPGSGHALPSNLRMSGFQFGRQPPRGLGYDFKATCHSVNRATICKELVNGYLTDE